MAPRKRKIASKKKKKSGPGYLGESIAPTNLSAWDKHFKTLKAKGAKPEHDFFEGIENTFDKKEW